MEAAATMAGTAQPPQRPGWWSTIGAVLAGTITAGVCCLTAMFALGALHLLPFDSRSSRSHGWPYPVDSAWAALADLGPMLAVGFVFAGTTSWYLSQKTGAHPRRWPLALVAAAVGWVPLDGEQHGFVLLGGGAAFAAVVIAARGLSLAERRPTPWSRPLVAALAAAVVVLGGVSFSYGALHPLRGDGLETTHAALIRDVQAERVAFSLDNRGPADVRILGVVLAGVPGLRLARAQRDILGGETVPSAEDLYRPLAGATLRPGSSVVAYLSLAADACAPPRVARPRWTVRTLDVRLRSAGVERTQRVELDHAQRVRCAPARG